MPKDDPPFLQIIGGYGHRHAVAQHHANAELAELAREVGLDVGALKTPWSDGTAALQLSRSELLQRIIALIPPPRKNESLYHGVFAPHHAWRREIVPVPPVDTTPAHLRIRLTKEPALGPQPAWLAWAALMWRIFQEDKVSCPRCGAPMRLRTVLLHSGSATGDDARGQGARAGCRPRAAV